MFLYPDLSNVRCSFTDTLSRVGMSTGNSRSSGAKGGRGVCVLRTSPSWKCWGRCFIHDEGRPLGVGVQAQTSNRGKRWRSRVVVVSVAGQGGARLRQVRITKTNASEPLRTCRKNVDDVETGIETLSREAGGGEPVYRSTGVRHEGGVIVMQAWMRNVGTCRSDAKGDAQVGRPRKRLSTEAGHRDGVAHSRDEGSVMEPDRRGGVVRGYQAGNSQEEDSHG